MSLSDTLRRAMREPQWARARLETVLCEALVRVNNAMVDLRRRAADEPSGFEPLDEITEHAWRRSDISDHLATLFLESLPVAPTLIVELGVRGGESTFALERVAAIYDAKLVSVDMGECARISPYAGWEFVQNDDIAFAGQFADWCSERGGSPAIDVLFIDTSHEFEHTAQEIAHWFPYLSKRARVFFHDTHIQRIFRRRDGSRGVGWDNQRGVMAAIEQYLGCSLDESRDFTTLRGEWIVRHYASCNGLTILERLPQPAPPGELETGAEVAVESASQ